MQRPALVRQGWLQGWIGIINGWILGNRLYGHLQELRTDTAERADIVECVGQISNDQFPLPQMGNFSVFCFRFLVLIHLLAPLLLTSIPAGWEYDER